MFRVRWRTVAMDELVAVYTTSDLDRQRVIAAAVESMNLRLAHRGPTVGESRAGDRRVDTIHPVTVYFYVDMTAREVVVTRAVIR